MVKTPSSPEEFIMSVNWLKCVPPNDILKFWPLAPVKVTSLGKSLYRYQVMMRSLGIARIQHDRCPYKKREIWIHRGAGRAKTDTEERQPCEDGGRDRSCAATGQEAGRGKERFSPELSERECISWHLDLGLLVSRTVREQIFVVLSYLVCGTLLQQS